MSMSGIPAICVIATAVVPVPAPNTIQIQAAKITMTRAATTTQRSRRSTVSRTLVSETVDTALGRVVRGGQTFAYTRRNCEPFRSGSTRCAPVSKARGVLGLVKHPTVREGQNYPLFPIRHRVADRLAVRPNDAGYLDPRPPPLEVPVELDFGKERILDRLNTGRKDLEHRADRLVSAGQDVEQRLALGLGGALIEHRLHDPLAMMERPRQVKGRRDCQVIEPHAFAPAVIDLECNEAGTVTIGRIGHRFARTTIIAAAIFDVPAVDLPVFARHFPPPLFALPVGLSSCYPNFRVVSVILCRP